MSTNRVHCAALDAACATERFDMKDLMKWFAHLAHEAVKLALFVAFHKYTVAASMAVKCLTGFWAVSSASTFEEAIWRLVLCIGSMSLDIVWYVGGLMAKRRLKLVSKGTGNEPATK